MKNIRGQIATSSPVIKPRRLPQRNEPKRIQLCHKHEDRGRDLPSSSRFCSVLFRSGCFWCLSCGLYYLPSSVWSVGSGAIVLKLENSGPTKKISTAGASRLLLFGRACLNILVQMGARHHQPQPRLQLLHFPSQESRGCRRNPPQISPLVPLADPPALDPRACQPHMGW